jgi:ribose transport system permease protein
MAHPPTSLPLVVKRHLATYGPLVALVLLLGLGALVHENFLTFANLENILTRTAFVGIIAIGATFVIASGQIDLSVGAMSALASGVMILAMNRWVGPLGEGWATIVAGMGVAVAVCLACGALNGLLVTKGRIEAFIVTLGTMGIFRSLVTWFADGGTLTLHNAVRETYRPVYFDGLLGVKWPIWTFAAVAVAATVLLERMRFGRYCLAVGSNAEAARYAAVPVDRVRWLAFVVQGFCVALATMIYVPRLGSASGSTGLMVELDAITAVILGGTALKGGSARIWSTVVGAILLSIVGNILNLSRVSPYLNGTIQGIIIILAVLVQRRRAGD